MWWSIGGNPRGTMFLNVTISVEHEAFMEVEYSEVFIKNKNTCLNINREYIDRYLKENTSIRSVNSSAIFLWEFDLNTKDTDFLAYLVIRDPAAPATGSGGRIRTAAQKGIFNYAETYLGVKSILFTLVVVPTKYFSYYSTVDVFNFIQFI
jgi:hypothetical protein